MWQRNLCDRITRRLASAPGVMAVGPHGSLVNGNRDLWSDLDIRVTVAADQFDRYFPATEWIAELGAVYATNQWSDKLSATTRVVFRNGERLDLRFESPAACASTRQPSSTQPPLGRLENDFRFEAFLAAVKLARNDLLIGAHLTLELERKALVIAMLLRDRDLGTSVHRFGGHWNEATSLIGGTGDDVPAWLVRIRRATDAFSTLAAQLDPAWTPDWEPLIRFVAQLEQSLQR